MLPENLVTNFLSGFQHRSKYGKDPTAGGKARTVQGCKVPQSCATLFPTLLSSPVASYVGPCLLAPPPPAIRQANVLAWGQEAKKSPLHFLQRKRYQGISLQSSVRPCGVSLHCAVFLARIPPPLLHGAGSSKKPVGPPAGGNLAEPEAKAQEAGLGHLSGIPGVSL